MNVTHWVRWCFATQRFWCFPVFNVLFTSILQMKETSPSKNLHSYGSVRREVSSNLQSVLENQQKTKTRLMLIIFPVDVFSFFWMILIWTINVDHHLPSFTHGWCCTKSQLFVGLRYGLLCPVWPGAEMLGWAKMHETTMTSWNVVLDHGSILIIWWWINIGW